jgi:phosphoserine phosphatase RsbU/P
MTVAELEHFRDLLSERQEGLQGWLNLNEPEYADEAEKVRGLLTDIRDALSRVDSGSFGECVVCKGEVELERLESQPVRVVCLDCITPTERALLEEELTLAGKMHRALLPQNVEKIEGFEMAVHSVAARVVGGDYYDFLPSTSSGLVRVVIADAMGKGIQAGLVMANLQGALRVLAEEVESPARLIARLNRWLCRNLPVPKFISLACVGLSSNGGGATRICHANAGHCPPILMRADGSVELLEATGTVVGVHEDFKFEEQTLAMHHGDLLFLYTDGVTEAENAEGEMYGSDRLSDFIRLARTRPVQGLVGDLLTELQSFVGRAEFEDDLTVIALRKAG